MDFHHARPEMYVLTLLASGEVFVFVYDAASRDEMVKHIAGLANDATCPITWKHAADLTIQIKYGGK